MPDLGGIEYGDVAWAFMRQIALDVKTATPLERAELLHQAAVVHELHVQFPGIRMVDDEAASNDVGKQEEPQQMGLADAARAARDEALARVDRAADAAWKQEAYEAIVLTAKRLPEFFSDDVWETGLDSTREDRALGPVFQRIARDRVAVKTERSRKSVRSHMTEKPIWRSLIYQPPGR